MAASCLLAVSPHPDDELIGAPATLMALRDAGWRVINLACSLGRPADRERRRAELERACELAGFELEAPDGLPPIGAADDLELAQRALSVAIAGAAERHRASLLVGPSPHDGHHGHEVVGRAIRDAVQSRDAAAHVLLWAIWGELPLPNVLVPFGASRLEEIDRALAAHAEELRRNRFDQLVRARGQANAVLGPERVLGFGARGGDEPYAELLTDVAWRPGVGWTLTAPRVLDPERPVGPAEGPEIGWWLHARSVRTILAAGGG